MLGVSTRKVDELVKSMGLEAGIVETKTAGQPAVGWGDRGAVVVRLIPVNPGHVLLQVAHVGQRDDLGMKKVERLDSYVISTVPGAGVRLERRTPGILAFVDDRFLALQQGSDGHVEIVRFKFPPG